VRIRDLEKKLDVNASDSQHKSNSQPTIEITKNNGESLLPDEV
jgi:hypothetical protein